MATHSKKSKHPLAKHAKEVAADRLAMHDKAVRARKMAEERAVVVRDYAKAWSKQADKRTRKARREAEKRREEMLDRVVAGAGVAMSVAPVVLQTLMTNKKARRRAAVTAGTISVRFNPIVVGVSVVGASFVGYKMWKRHHDSARDAADADAFDEDPPKLQHERMDDEGPMPGAYDVTPHQHLKPMPMSHN